MNDAPRIPPRDFDGLKTLLVDAHDDLPKRLRQVAAFVVDHPDEVAFGSAASIAERAKVQPSTLVRFAQTIGYAGFSDLQRVFRSRLRHRRPDYADRIASIHADDEVSNDPRRLLLGFAESAMRSLDRLRDTVTAERLAAAIDRLAAATTIYVLGQRRSFPVALYLAYALPKLGIRSVLIDNLGSLGPEQAADATPQDAVLAISFAPYTPLTVDMMGSLSSGGVPIIAITDSAFSPLTRHASIWFEVVESDFGDFRSLSATLCLVMALAVGVAERRQDRGAVPNALNPEPDSP
ncbi:transcriptional regulator, RpiR family [Rhizobiales bacterium GAS191]|jgi:DNA-binding MurR/RpiR family transcriptional regulator|nr:transcriptional regulator, RpiR family [Rhizobiales bacterium GAS113]SEC85540.1 transcriptional regulator, RpiR family [Rhizobiales bacterium GAS191]